VTTPNDSWVPTADEPLFILAMDHRASFGKDVFGITGEWSPTDLTRMRQAKGLIYEGLRHVAGRVPSGREGVLVDEDLGAEVARTAKSDGVVLLMPIEKSGSRVFELEFGEQFAEHVEAFDPDFFKLLVRFNPLDDDSMRRTQRERLAMVSQWAEHTNRRWIIELLVPPTPEQLAAHADQAGFDAQERPALTAQVISELYAGGVYPTIWKLEGYETEAGADIVLAAVATETDHPAVCIVLGRDAPLSQVEHWLAVGARCDLVGFAVGRTIWEEALRQHLAGTLSGEGLVDAVAENYSTLVDAFLHASPRLRSSGQQSPD
jgi:myo-inositol catabolism protein IolC